MQGSAALQQAAQWLADAPLFLDELQVGSFYDAVVRPETAKDSVIIAAGTSKSTATTVGGEAAGEASLGLIAHVIPGLKVSLKAKADRKRERQESHEQTVTLKPIDNPQRQLIHLTLHYGLNLPGRLRLATPAEHGDWAAAAFISELPRALVFLDLPAGSMLIPAALERGDGTVTTIFNLLEKDQEKLPKYPQWAKGSDPDDLREQRKSYWSWFRENFNDTRAMLAVEEAAEHSGGIRWIDYRMPLGADGETLHLHLQARGKYDSGTFAYNMVKRGFKHGLRIAGILKSEPDMNVLAVFEK
jgi:hypothetical protein